MADIKARLRRVLVESLRLDCEPHDVPDTGLVDKFAIDSIASLEFLIWVEDEFQIQIDDADLTIELVDSLTTLAAYIEARTSVHATPAPEADRAS